MFIQKGIRHPPKQNVLWLRALSDGLLKRKRKRLPHPRATNDLEDGRNLSKAFIQNPQLSVPTIDQLQRAAPVDYTDESMELVPEAYLTQPPATPAAVAASLQATIRGTLAYLVKIDRVDLLASVGPPGQAPLAPAGWAQFVAGDMFHIERGHFHSIADLEPGQHITISRISEDNGFVGFYEAPEGASVWPAGTITVSTVTGDAFAQPVPFIATDNVVMCTPKPEFAGFTPASLTFAAQMIADVKWRYSYGRQCYQSRFAKTEFSMPVLEDGTLDYSYMEQMVEAVPYWPLVREAFARH